jgi:arginyl-tRNA--protein-N-Asp/Glu arginylyltransferase
MTAREDLPKIYLSMPHECGYLPDKIATTIFVDPHAVVSNPIYSLLVQQGFRRSGDLVYRPECQDCNACIPVRIPVDSFHPSRGQRRVWQRNRDLVVTEGEARFSQEHFDLYRKYQRTRHTGGSMDTDDPARYRDFLFGSVGDTRVLEIRRAGAISAIGSLLAVAVIDRLQDGLSAVYTFFDPSESHRGLGIYAILYEIELARTLELPHLYLGYYIAESPKMDYKLNFQPLEGLRNRIWAPLPREGTLHDCNSL